MFQYYYIFIIYNEHEDSTEKLQPLALCRLYIFYQSSPYSQVGYNGFNGNNVWNIAIDSRGNGQM